MQTPMSPYEPLGWFLMGSVVFLGISTFVSKRISPFNPTQAKLTSYECGEATIGGPYTQFILGYHKIALLFLLFELELLFLFPWAVAAAHPPYEMPITPTWKMWMSGELFLFLALLAIGLIYIWKKNYLRLSYPKETFPKLSKAQMLQQTSPPAYLYEVINERYKSAQSHFPHP